MAAFEWKCRLFPAVVFVVSLAMMGKDLGRGGQNMVQARSVQVNLTSSWMASTLYPIQEVSEFLAEEGNEHFWAYIDSIAQEETGIKIEEDEKEDEDTLLERALLKAAPIVGGAESGLMKVLRILLASRGYSPTIEMHQQLGLESHLVSCNGDTSAWGILYSIEGCAETIVCSPAELDEALSGTTSRDEKTCASSAANDFEMDFDHKYPQSIPARRTLILYAGIGTNLFRKYHSKLVQYASQGVLHYILRHFSATTKSPIGLRGYGVVLDIKNMEYKNMDDSQKESAGSTRVHDKNKKKNVASTVKDMDAGVELVDQFISSVLVKKNTELDVALKAFRDELAATLPSNTKIRSWTMKDLGATVVSEIVSAKDPLFHLETLSQDFPKHARRLASFNQRISSSMRNEMELNRKLVSEAGFVNKLLINGIQVDMDVNAFNVFDVLRDVRHEFVLSAQFARLQLPDNLLDALYKAGTRITSNTQDNEIRIDLRPTGSKSSASEKKLNDWEALVPIYINDIENDEGTENWPRDVEILKYPSWNLITLRKNMYELIIVCDPTSVQGREALMQAVMLVQRGAPIKVGFLMASKEKLDWSEARLHDDAISTMKSESPLIQSQHINSLLASLLLKEDAKIKATRNVVVMFLAHYLREQPSTVEELLSVYSSVLGGTFGQSKARKRGLEALQDRKLAALTAEINRRIVEKGIPFNCFLFNGVINHGLDIQSNIMQLLGNEQRHYMEMAKRDMLDDDSDLLHELFLYKETYASYLSIMKSEDTVHFVSLADANSTLAAIPQLLYLHQVDTKDLPKPQSAIVLVDLNTVSGRSLAKNAIDFVLNRSRRGVRICILHNPAESRIEARPTNVVQVGDIMAILLDRIGETDHAKYLDVLYDLLEKSLAMTEYDAWIEEATQVLSLDSELVALLDALQPPSLAAFQKVTQLTRDFLPTLKVRGGEALVLVNGMSVLPSMKEMQSKEFFSVLFAFDHNRRAQHIAKAILRSKIPYVQALSPREKSDLVFQASALIGLYTRKTRWVPLNPASGLQMKYSGVQKKGSSLLNLHGYFDPLSIAAQRISSILRFLHRDLNASLSLTFLPQPNYEEFPLRGFYRFSFDASTFNLVKRSSSSKESSSSSSNVQFVGLPRSPILTLKLDTPESWNVQMIHAEDDLDNLQSHALLKEEGEEEGGEEEEGGGTGEEKTQLAEFQLKSLIVHGRCEDITSMFEPPPSGLQLVLEKRRPVSTMMDGAGKTAAAWHTDTLVMRNLAYFQLQATPGVWTLKLAHGRASDLYDIVDEHELRIPFDKVVVHNFDSTLRLLRVKKRVGREMEQLLDDVVDATSQQTLASLNQANTVTAHGEFVPIDAMNSLWARVASFFFGTPTTLPTKKELNVDERSGERIHVFSLASGALYERFLKIMMLSVMKRTRNPVTFWLLENFLSPAFKESLPALKAELGIEVRLVTYKWPSWLRQQTEKQRIIWGYKILFLDVLFPLDVHKIIYVDADQVVRADIKELWNMDLKGHSYAYTPFCASRKETLGFQFWRSGFWKDHLRGKPYHISALYVVDLVTFRRRAAGDILRAVYDQLSRDPHSLANLDQDLPNYVQHQIPIFSLPQDWLWCESWCSDASKASSKTIDLCNNPLHKEPKLDMAKRVISGSLFPEDWATLDRIVRAAEEGSLGLPNNTTTTT